MDLSRRDVLKLAVAGSVSGLAACSAPKEIVVPVPAPAPIAKPPSNRMPVVFVSHGSPMAAIAKDDYAEALKWMGEDLPLPKAIVVISAHWQEEAPIRVTAGERPVTIHDFGGFPDKLHRLLYPSPGQPQLADEVAKTLTAGGFPARLEDRGLDHGAWVPLILTYPGAEIPVIQVTLRHDLQPADYLRLGALLAPLRDRGVLIFGSGGVVHSFPEMRRLAPGEKTDTWAVEFDTWFRERIGKGDIESVANYRTAHPGGARSAPTTEHFDPIFVSLGARMPGDQVVDVYEGFRGANLSMRTFLLKS
jgi:4,5-DOPA dioxygenase extradiol